MEPTPAPLKIFISFNKADRSWAEWIAWTLKEAGYSVVYQDWDFRPGSNFVLEMQKATAGTDKTVAVLSEDFLKSAFTQPEWAAAFAKDATGKDRTLIPVRVAECSPDGLLSQIIWVDLVGLSEETAREALLQAFKESGRPDRAPAFPGGAPKERVTYSAVPFPGMNDQASPLSRVEGVRWERGSGGEVGPSLHNLPHPRLGPLFTGRQEELDALESGETAAITQSEAISGLGGIGKTRLAVEYAWRSGSRYTAAWFVRADSPEGLHRNLAALAHPELLNLPEWEEQVEEKTIAAVKRWLREHPGWLMILDNVDTPEAQEAVLQILPALSKGRVLITSRLRNWPASVQKQSLEKLSVPEATQFLLHRTESGREKAHDDAARGADLAGVLDGLPLALEQAAAYIVRHQMSFAEYLRAWEQERSEVLKWFDPRVMGYPASVAVTWKQTFDQLSPTAASLLRLMSFLAPEPIPIFLLEQGAEFIEEATALFCEETGKEPKSQAVRAAIGDLADYSMVSRQDGGAVTVHRIVQETLKDRIPEERMKAWIESALRIVNRAAVGDPSDVRTWPVWDLLRPHAAKIVVAADEAGIAAPTSRLMNQLGVLLHGKSRYSEAEPLIRRALSIGEASFGTDHPDVVNYVNNLAMLLQDTNRSEEAEPLMRRTLAIAEASFGTDHPKVAISLNNLAALLYYTNRLEEAELLMRRALTIDESSLGMEHPNVALRLNNLAQVLKATNRLEEAEPLMRRALAIDEISVGTNHPDLARDLNNLALLLQDTTRLEEAEPLMRRATNIFEKSLGSDHPNTQKAQGNLESLLAAMGSSAPEGDSTT